jgi:hypothetical protein
LRIWLEASVLFAAGQGGRPSLFDTGKARIDSAMGDFLQYARSGPVVLEGYAQAGASAERCLESRRQAESVRSYLLEKFALRLDGVGVMPLGSEALGSPTGNRWDGVATAVLVPKEAVKK